MPASVPSRLPASYLRDRILQTPRKKNDVKQGGKKKRPCGGQETPLVLVRAAGMKNLPSSQMTTGDLFSFRGFWGQFWLPVWLCVCNSNLWGNKGGRCEATGVPQTD